MKLNEFLPKLTLHGRTVVDDEKQALFFNWTCSGFTVKFTGKILKARMTVMGDDIPAIPGFPPNPTYYPFFGVVGEDGETLLSRTEVLEDGWFTVWEGEESCEHTLRVVKLSENSRGKLGLLELETDGEILQAPANTKPTIEIVGDSITCAFGNEAPYNAFEFKTSEENGWMSYAAIAARELGYEFSLVSESGISATSPEHPLFPMHSMTDIYDLTDELYDVRRGVEPVKWDFAKYHNDIVVLNLGTNDCNPIRFCPNIEEVDSMEDYFRGQYRKFIEKVRASNGKDTVIACVLGPMDYYLYEKITEAVNEYIADTGDKNIVTFKFVGINMVTEGYGAAGHPSLKTHVRVGHELAVRLRQYVIK